MLALILGYIFNDIGHMIESTICAKFLDPRIQKNIENHKKGGWFVRFFSYFSVMRSLGKLKEICE